MGRETVLDARAGFVLTLTLNRPAQKNAFNTVQWRELRDALRDARADDSVRAVVITGAGGAFSAGQDLVGDGASAADIGPRPRSRGREARSRARTRSASSSTSCARSTSR